MGPTFRPKSGILLPVWLTCPHSLRPAVAKSKKTGARRTAASGAAQEARTPPDRCNAGPPHSAIADDLLAFADNLRANMTEAQKFCEEDVAKRLGWDATKKAETHFFTRATQTHQALRQRRKEFDDLEARCKTTDPCRRLIDDLAGCGLQEAIDVVAADLKDIAKRAGRPLSGQDRVQLHDDLQGLLGFLDSLLDVAAWIEDEAGASRGEAVPSRSRRSGAQPEPALPPEIATAVRDAESDVQKFVDIVAESASALKPGNTESVLAWLKRLGAIIHGLEAASNKVVKRLNGFTDRHRQAAEREGNTRFLQFLDKRERMLKRLAARRAISTGLVKRVIDRLQARLSLSDDAAHVAAETIVQLNDLSCRLQADQRRLERQADDATNERLANAVTAAQLPSWNEILGHGESNDGAPSNLAMLLMAFVDYSGKTPDFEPATRKHLQERLDRSRRGYSLRSLSRRQFDKLLEKAQELKIVFMHDRPKKLKRTVGDKFSLCNAAIRKHRSHLIRPQSEG